MAWKGCAKMMMMMNCFCGNVDWRKAVNLIFSWNHCQRSSPSGISDMPQAGFEPVQNLSSSLVEWSCLVLINTIPWRHVQRQQQQSKNKLWLKYSKNWGVWSWNWSDSSLLSNEDFVPNIENHGGMSLETLNKRRIFDNQVRWKF